MTTHTRRWRAAVRATGTVFLGAMFAASAGDLAIAVSNRGEAEIIETRQVGFRTGTTDIRWEGVSTRVDLDTVQFRLPERRPLQSTDLRLEHDTRNRDQLLKRALNKTVQLIRPETHERISGTVLGIERGQISLLRLDSGELWLNPAGEVLLPPDDGIVFTPTLTCDLQSDLTGPQDLRLTYRTGGLPWHVIYTCVFDEASSTIEVAAAMLLRNDTGVDYEKAACRFFAVEKTKTEGLQPVDIERLIEYRPAVPEEGVSLPARETARLQLLGATRVPAGLTYTFDPLTSGPAVNVPEQKLQQAILFTNSDAEDGEGLGLPLPSGKVKISRRHASGLLQSLGERGMPFTDTEETLEIRIGPALGLFGKRVQTPFVEDVDQRVQEQQVTVSLRNERDADVIASVVEHPWGRWTIPESSPAFEKVNNETIEFQVLIPANGEAEVQYRLQIAY